MTVHTVTDPKRCFYFNCRDCGCALSNEQDRKLGLCLHCLEIRLSLIFVPRRVLIVNGPTSAARWN